MLDTLNNLVHLIDTRAATLRAGIGYVDNREDSPEPGPHIYGQAIPVPRGQREQSYFCPLCREHVDALHYEGVPHHDRLMLVRDIADLLAGVSGKATEQHMGEVTQWLWERGIFR